MSSEIFIEQGKKRNGFTLGRREGMRVENNPKDRQERSSVFNLISWEKP